MKVFQRHLDNNELQSKQAKVMLCRSYICWNIIFNCVTCDKHVKQKKSGGGQMLCHHEWPSNTSCLLSNHVPTKQLIWSFFHLATSLCFLSAPWSLTLEWWNVSVEPSCCSFYIFSFTFGGPTSSIQQTVSFLTDFLVFLLKAHTKTSTFTHNVNFHPPTSGYPIHTLDIPSLDQCTETDDHSHSWAL